MRQTWRWFGPNDAILIDEIRQTGAVGVVSALHHIPPGEVWPFPEIKLRKELIEKPAGVVSGLTWDVVESVPVSEAIKSQRGPVRDHLAAYRESLINLGANGIKTVCYNFMPVLDWTRTDLKYPLKNGGNALCFDLVDFAAFDCFILKRTGAASDYSEQHFYDARIRFERMSEKEREALSRNIVAGLPGANDNWSLSDVTDCLNVYGNISTVTLRSHLIDFLSEIIPTAEKLGMRLCCHPDDPPFSLLGLPRILSKRDDFVAVLDAIDSPANGVTLCTGSLGASDRFDAAEFIKLVGHKIHFAHLRNVIRSGPRDRGRMSFAEAEHLNGDVDMISALQALLDEENQRRAEGREDCEIPMRPDHGHALLDDHNRKVQPGYPLIGRLRGLAELRGAIAAINKIHG